MKRESERGNVLWFILIAIVLLGALTMILSRSGSSVDQSGDFEQQRIKAGQMMRFGSGIEAAIENMKLSGISENDISFERPGSAVSYASTSCTGNACKLFHAEGAGLGYSPAPGGANDGSEWIFTGANNVGTAAAPVGTTGARSGNDLVMLLPNASTNLCIQINRDLDVGTAGTLPVDTTGIDTTEFTGVYASSLTLIDGDPSPFELDGKRAGCFIDEAADPDVTYFYYVLLAR